MSTFKAKFFSTQPSTTVATRNRPEKIGRWLDSYSRTNLLYPLLKEGDYVWTEDFSCLYLGDRGLYREWLEMQETLPNPSSTVGFYPLGLVLCVVDGARVYNNGHTGLSNACAGSSDFSALAHALSDGKVGKGVYTTYCKHFGIPVPRYLDNEGEEENNFLQEFFQKSFASRK